MLVPVPVCLAVTDSPLQIVLRVSSFSPLSASAVAAVAFLICHPLYRALNVGEVVGGLFKTIAEDVIGEVNGGSLAVRVAGPEGPRVTPQSIALAVPELAM